MKVLNIFFISFISLFLLWHLTTRKYRFRSFVVGYIGKKGCGKSTIGAKFCKQFLNRGYKVYTNMDDIRINGVRIFNTFDLGKNVPEEGSVIILDEISIFFNSRDWANTSKELLEFIAMVRHYHCNLIYFSQHFNLTDKQLREQTDALYLLKRHFRVLSIARLIDKELTLRESAMTAEDQLVDGLKFAPIYLPGSIKLCWIPRYVKYFDSFKLFSDKPLLEYREVKKGFEVRKVHKKRK